MAIKKTLSDDEKCYIAFGGVAEEVANEHHASVTVQNSEKFLSLLWEDFKTNSGIQPDLSWYENDPPETVRAWLINRLRETFLYVGVPPKWLHEAFWGYDNEGMPMKFLGVVSEPESEKSEAKSVYVFEGREKIVGGVTPFYRLIVQYNSSPGTSVHS